MLLPIVVAEILTLLGFYACTASRDPLLIVAEGSTIQSLSTNFSISKLHVSLAVAIDVLAAEERIFWSDGRSKTITTGYFNGTGSKIIVRTLYNPDGLAVDWMARLIYFTDAGLNAIGVTDFEGHHVILLREDLDQPRAIAVDPAEGYMYWTDWGTVPKVERAYMSGRARETLADTGINTWPNGLALDHIQRRLYWVDAQHNRIETCYLDGKSRQVVMQESRNIHPFGLALVSSDLYWSDWSDNSLYRTSTKSGVTTQVAAFDTRPYGVAVWNTSQQTGSNVCSNGNGGCEQLCLAEPSAAICACSVGRLQADNKTCKSPERYLLVVDSGRIRGLFTTRTENRLLNAIRPLETLTGAVTVEFDSKTGKIFYADVETGAIVQVSADGSQKVVLNGLAVIESIGFDWTTDNLYFVDSGRDEIGVAAVNRPLSKILISDNLDEPKSIVLDPKEGMMYWTDSGSKPKIERSDMSGAFRHTLIGTGLGRPNGITLDRENQVVYWVDALYNRVETCKTDGTSRSILLDTPSIHPFGVAFFDNQLYWTDRSLKSIVRFDVIDRNYTRMTVQFPPMAKPTGLVRRDSSLQNGTSSCSVNNGECRQLCLPVPSGRRCACTSNHSRDCLPRLLSHVTVMEAWEGTKTTLPCVVTDAATNGLPLVRVDWFKSELHIRAVTGDGLASGNFPLVIKNVTLLDVGRYVCRVTNHYGSVRTNVSLTVILGTRSTTTATTVASTRSTTTTTTVAGVGTRTPAATVSPYRTASQLISTQITLTPKDTTHHTMTFVTPKISRSSSRATGLLTTPKRSRTSKSPLEGTRISTEPGMSPSVLTDTANSLVDDLPNASNTSSSSGTGLNLGLVGGLIGCFCAAVLIILVTAMWFRKTKRKPRVAAGPQRHREVVYNNPIQTPSENVHPLPSSPQNNLYSHPADDSTYSRLNDDPVYDEIKTPPTPVGWQTNCSTSHYQEIFEKSVGIKTGHVDRPAGLPSETEGYMKMKLAGGDL